MVATGEVGLQSVAGSRMHVSISTRTRRALVDDIEICFLTFSNVVPVRGTRIHGAEKHEQQERPLQLPSLEVQADFLDTLLCVM